MCKREREREIASLCVYDEARAGGKGETSSYIIGVFHFLFSNIRLHRVRVSDGMGYGVEESRLRCRLGSI